MYQVIILPKAFEYLSKIDKTVAVRITDKLTWLSENIEKITPLPLKGDFTGLYKLKVGDWRIIYDIDHNKKIITVHMIGHRKEIYR